LLSHSFDATDEAADFPAQICKKTAAKFNGFWLVRLLKWGCQARGSPRRAERSTMRFNSGRRRRCLHSNWHLLAAAALLAKPLVPAAFADPPLPSFGPNVYNVTVSNPAINGGTPASTGSADNATALNAYISYCSTHGGGAVEIPSGTFMSGTVTMLSNVNLQIDSGAILRNTNFANTLIQTNGSNATNMEISGSGIIDGNATTTVGSNKLVNLQKVNTLEVTGVSIENAGNEHLTPENDTNVTLLNVTIADPGTLAANGGHYLANTDGIDFWGSHFLIKNCNVSDGDDNIVAKPASGAVSDATITGCTLGAGHGISVGGGSAHGVNGLTVTNCTFNGTTNGLRLKAQDASGGDAGGGTANPVTNVSYSNITMTNVQNPIIIDSFYNGNNNFPSSPTDSTKYPASPTPVGATTPIWQNISFNNVTATGSSNGGLIYGLNTTPNNTQNVSFNNVNISASSQMNFWYGSGIDLSGLTVNVPAGNMYANNSPVKGVFTYALSLSVEIWNNLGTGGGSGTTWDTASDNWNNGGFTTGTGAPVPTTYSNGNAVAFTDSNNGHYAVTLNTTVSPASVIVNNTAGNYAFSGSGGISGSGGLTKNGTGILTISTHNAFTGDTNVNAGTLTLTAAGTLGSATINVAGGATLNAVGSLASTATVTANGPVNFGASGSTTATTQQLASLTIGGGVTASITSSATGTPFVAKTLQPTALVFTDSSSKLDITNNILISQGTPSAAEELINVTHNVITSTSGLVLGYKDATGVNYEIRATLLGDSDLDGLVNVADLANLAGNFGVTTGALWINGDFDNNGNVNVADLADLAGNFGKTLTGTGSAAAAAGASPAASATSVPEPAAVASLLTLTTAGCIRRRRARPREQRARARAR
jgi:autotransporter-associated beta strand protein